MSIRVFVGCAANNEDLESQAVLDYSLRRHASKPIEITWMQLSPNPKSPFYANIETGEGWNIQRWATPFSGLRWAVPFLCDYKGKAIYMDSDMIVLDDISKLWDQELTPGKVVLAKGKTAGWRYCTSLWDCEAAKRYLLPIEQIKSNPHSHFILIKYFANNQDIVQPFDGNWNCLDGEDYQRLDDADIKVIHYTKISSQPHLKYALPRLARTSQKHWYHGELREHSRSDVPALFDRILEDAKQAGYLPENYEREKLFGPYRNNVSKDTQI